MECFWCMTEYKDNAKVLKDFCSPEMNTELSAKMDSNLASCLDCVMAYHYARQYFLKRNQSAQKELFLWEVNRLGEHIRSSLDLNGEIKSDENCCDWQEDETSAGDDILEKLTVPLQEILSFPYLLWSEELASLATQALLRLEEDDTPLVLQSKLPGVYVLAIHPNAKVRTWAKMSVESLGSISCDDYDDLRDVVKWILNVSEFDLWSIRNLMEDNVLPPHLFMETNAKEYWAGVCALLKKFDERTMRLQLLSRDNHYQFVTLLFTAMDEKHSQNDSRDSEFWPLFNCLLMILNRLGPRIWQHINVEKHSDLFYLVVLHPAFLKEVKSLPGYIGQDREVGEGCTVSCNRRLNNKDSAEQRSLNEHGLESSESFRFPMFDWFKSFMESAVSFGDGAKEGVEVMFKYFSCLKVEFEIPSEGYDYIMMAMLHCLEFLVKKSLKSFLDATAKRWIPCVVEILKLDADELPCQKQAISFCRMFLHRKQEFQDVSRLITWLEMKSRRNVKNDPQSLGRLKELLTLHFRDLPPLTRQFKQERRTILVTTPSSSKPFSASRTSRLASPLLDGRVCLEKLPVVKTSQSRSKKENHVCDDNPKNDKTNLRGAENRRDPIILPDSSDEDDDMPLGLRFGPKSEDDEKMITYVAISSDDEETTSIVNNVQDDVTLGIVDSCVERKINELESAETRISIASGLKRKAKDLHGVESPASLESEDKHGVNDLPGEETFSEVNNQLQEIQHSQLKEEEPIAGGEQADKQEVDVLEDENIVESQDKYQMEDSLHIESLASEIPGMQHELKEVQETDNEVISTSFPVNALLPEPRTTRDAERKNILPTGKIAQPSQVKSSLSNIAKAPLSTNDSVKRMKTVETKPSKPLAVEELYYMILKWDPNMLMKNFSPEIANSGKVRLTYETMDEYYSVFKPLLFLECWAQAVREWQQSKAKDHLTCVVKSIKDFSKHFLFVVCHQRIAIRRNCEERFLKESDLIIVKMKDENLRPLFALVENIKQVYSPQKPGDEDSRDTQYFDLTITFRLIPKDRPICINETLRCVVVMSLVTTFRQWKGMMFLPRSLLARDILQPRIDKCCNNTFVTAKSAADQRVYNKSQVAAIDGTVAAIRLPYPIPRISFIQGPPGTGKSHTIIGLIKSYLKNREIDLKAEKGSRLPGSKVNNNQASGKILLCAPSNAAVYVLVRRMIAEMKLRAGEKGTLKSKNCGSINLVCVGRSSLLHPGVLPFALNTLAKAEVSKRSIKIQQQAKIAQEKVDAVREKIEDLEKNGYQLRLAGFKEGTEQLKSINTQIEVMVSKKQKLEQEYLHIRRKTRMLKHEEDKIKKGVLFSADVICCTLSGSGSVLLHKLLKISSAHVPFGCVIVDEACQSCELDLLIPLQFGSSKLVMVGDPEQLRSTVISKKAQELLLGQSMYERLYKFFKKKAYSNGQALHMAKDNPIQLLDLQYRMHPQISLFPAKYIYQGRVKDERSLETRKSVCSLTPYALLNVGNAFEQVAPSGSLCNAAESDLIVEICWALKEEIAENHFGVVTPYREQVNLTRKRLNQRGLQKVEVDTVDGFQGREKDIVIMSCVRAKAGRHKSIGFLADRTRLNVALTRAKYSLIILLNVDSLETNSDWRACIDDARQRGVLHDVNSPKDLSKIFQKEPIRDFKTSSTIPVSSVKQMLPTQVNAPTDNETTNPLASHGSVQSNNIPTNDFLPSHTTAEAENESASTENSLPLHEANTASCEQISSSDEFDFEDFDPQICTFHRNGNKPSKEQLCGESANCEVSLPCITGELVDFVVHCGENIQAKQNSYMQQLVEHERVEKKKTKNSKE